MRRISISTMCMAGALMLAASCNSIEENIPSVEGDGGTVITAVAEAIGGGTKAHNQYSYDVLWDKNDQIYVTDGKKANTFTVSDESAGTNKGMFTEDTPHLSRPMTDMSGPQSRSTIRLLRCMRSRPFPGQVPRL